GAAHGADMLAELGTVGQPDGDDRLARHGFERRVGLERDLGALAQDLGVLHARDIVRGVKRHGLVDQHHGDHVLKTDIGNFAVVDNRGLTGAEPYDHLVYTVGVERVPGVHDL